MKLWMKLTAISLIVTVTVLSICLVFFIGIQSESMKEKDEDTTRKALQLYCMNITSVVNADTSRIQEVTLRSMVDYYFSTYAQLLQGGGTYYTLAQDKQYIFNTNPYYPVEAYGNTEIPHLTNVNNGMDKISALRISTDQGTGLISAVSFQISDQSFDAYIFVDVSDTSNRILQMWQASILILLVACMGVAVFTAILMRRALHPVTKLTESAIQISNGEYSQRTTPHSNDEIGQLSKAFNRMADSIQNHIQSLDDQIQKRQLLLSALTHELKTPMTAIIGYADSLLHMPLNEDQRIECANNIYDAGKRTEALSQKLMELIGLSESQSISMKEFSTSDFVDTLKLTTSEQVHFIYETSTLYGDKTLLHSMLINLINNAIKASPDDEIVNVTIRSEKNQYQILVTDRGCGIPKEYISLVTEPFFRVDKARSKKDGGTGLGLALSAMIAEKHGGRLEIESIVGVGTRVSVTLLQLDNKSLASQ